MLQEILQVITGNRPVQVEVDADGSIDKVKAYALPVGIGLFAIILCAVLLALLIMKELD